VKAATTPALSSYLPLIYIYICIDVYVCVRACVRVCFVCMRVCVRVQRESSYYACTVVIHVIHLVIHAAYIYICVCICVCVYMCVCTHMIQSLTRYCNSRILQLKDIATQGNSYGLPTIRRLLKMTRLFCRI